MKTANLTHCFLVCSLDEKTYNYIFLLLRAVMQHGLLHQAKTLGKS